jgi:DnaK suppressor protein
MSRFMSEEIIQLCKKKLLESKQDLLNRVRNNFLNFRDIDKASGDEIDQSVAHLEEHSFLISQERLKFQIVEIEMALSRIEQGTYGYCEETEEPIESDRLLAVPWTRLSIEGAELRESMSRKYAR